MNRFHMRHTDFTSWLNETMQNRDLKLKFGSPLCQVWRIFSENGDNGQRWRGQSRPRRSNLTQDYGLLADPNPNGGMIKFGVPWIRKGVLIASVTGYAYCSVDDLFNKATGIKVATSNIVKMMHEEYRIAPQATAHYQLTNYHSQSDAPTARRPLQRELIGETGSYAVKAPDGYPTCFNHPIIPNFPKAWQNSQPTYGGTTSVTLNFVNPAGTRVVSVTGYARCSTGDLFLHYTGFWVAADRALKLYYLMTDIRYSNGGCSQWII